MASTIPYIGSKISLISNSEIRYEGILYTINTQESTIALQSVKTFGTEGRKIPEIPPSSEIYDFIIFRGTDIKDLTVLEGAQGSSPMSQDPAIMSMNQRPAGGGGKDGHKGGGKPMGGKDGNKGGASHDSRKGWGQTQSWGQPAKGGGDMGGYGGGWGGGSAWGNPKGDGGYGKGGGKWDDGKSRGGYGGGYQAMKGSDKGKSRDDWGSKGGKGHKGGKDDGKGKGKGKMDGGKGGYGKGDYGKGGKGDRGGNRSKGSSKGVTASGVPVGELLPEQNEAVKKEYAEDFDLTSANTKFEKVTEDAEETKKPLTGYNKSSSFFDNISCEATDRAAETERPRVDREKARQYDKDTFGDTRRPPRLAGVRRGKGKGSGKGS